MYATGRLERLWCPNKTADFEALPHTSVKVDTPLRHTWSTLGTHWQDVRIATPLDAAGLSAPRISLAARA